MSIHVNPEDVAAMELGTNQVAFADRAACQCKGRNGYFWPVAATLTQIVSTPEPYVMLDIEGSKSLKGAEAPISVRLTREDMKRLALWVLEQMAAEDRLTPGERMRMRDLGRIRFEREQAS